MRFHLVSIAMFSACGLLLYWLLVGFQNELSAARPKVRKESVHSVTQESKWQENSHLETYINKNITEKNHAAAAIVTQEAMRIPNPVEPLLEPGIMSRDSSDFWCKPTPVRLERAPVKCLYPTACYGCDGAPILRPEVESAIPLCENGQIAQSYNVECCPRYHGGSVECPSPEECFQADNVPQEFCSCNNRPDCKLIDIAGSIQCMCAP